MKFLSFEDPNISTQGTFEVNGYQITAPVFTAAGMPGIVDSTSRHAASYFTFDNLALEAVNKAFARWGDPTYTLRQKALPVLADLTQFSEPNIVCFGLMPLRNIRFEPERLRELPKRLNDLIETGRHRSFTSWGDGYLKGYGTPRVAFYDNPKKVLQILAGNVVGPTWLSVCLGAVLNCPQFIKLSHHDLASFMFYLESLNDLAPDFRQTIACGYYSSSEDVNEYLLKEADGVVAMGSDDTVNAIRARLSKVNRKSRLIPHGLKIGFQVIGKEYAVPAMAELAAWGIAAFDGNGCFSPANIYVENGGRLTPHQFGESLAAALEALSDYIPPKRTLSSAERVTRFRHSQIQRRLVGEKVRIIKPANTDYTVVIDNENPELTPTCQERTVIVKPVEDIGNVPQYVRHLSLNLQTVGLAVPRDDLVAVSEGLGAVGVTNIKAVGTEYRVDIAEPHDGIFDFAQLSMSDNLRWASISFSDTDMAIEQTLAMKEVCRKQLAGQAGLPAHTPAPPPVNTPPPTLRPTP